MQKKEKIKTYPEHDRIPLDLKALEHHWREIHAQ
jgi:hypothetical protein